MGTVLIRHPLIQLDSGVVDPDCKSKMVRGLNRDFGWLVVFGLTAL